MLTLKFDGVALTMMFLKALEIETAGAVVAPNLYSASRSHRALSLSPDGGKWC